MKRRITCIIVSLLVLINTTALGFTMTTSKARGPITIRLAMKDESPTNPASVAYFNQLEKNIKADTGLDVNFDIVQMPSGNYAEKLNLMLMSGNIPDIIYFQGGDQPMAQQGLLTDLTSYIKNSKNIKNIMYPHNAERMKNYPYLLYIKPISQTVPVMRLDWFNNLNASTTYPLLKNPTIDNYYKFLSEIKHSHPGKNNKPAYAITIAGNLAEIDNIFNRAFGVTATWIKDKTGKYVYSKTTTSEKNKLAFYNKLYKGGILDPQFMTKKWDTKEKAFYNGDTAIMSGSAGKVIDMYDGKIKIVSNRTAGLIVLPPAKGVDQGYGFTDVTKESRGIAISSQSKNKDICFQILDYMASAKGQMLDRLGFENQQYKVVDGKIALTDKSQEWYSKFWEPAAFKPTLPLKNPLLGKPAQQSLDAIQKYYKKDTNFLIPEKYTANWDAMNNLYNEFAFDVITGKRPISDFDKFVSDWNKAGGTDLTKYANQVLKK